MFLQAKSDHTDLVSRRMGFIPLPLACLVSGCGLVCEGVWSSVRVRGVRGVA